MLNSLKMFTPSARAAVERVSRSPYLKSIEDVGNNKIMAFLEKDGKRIQRFIEANRFCNNTYLIEKPSCGAIKTVFSTPNVFGGGGKTEITVFDKIKNTIKHYLR